MRVGNDLRRPGRNGRPAASEGGAPISTSRASQAATSYKILLIAGIRYPIREPFVGGLECHTALLAQGLRNRGHTVVVAAGQGSDSRLVDIELPRLPQPADGRLDVSADSEVEDAETAAYARLIDDLRNGLLGSFDLMHNNSLHQLPVRLAQTLPCPVVTTLHTPELPWAAAVAAAIDLGAHDFVAVSRATARMWSARVRAQVVLNGVDTNCWPLGPGGGGAVWSGRIAPEKAPHLALDIAEAAGLPLTLAGPIIDRHYFDHQLAPRLGRRVHYAGSLKRHALARLVGAAGVALVTPVWEEPFGMVVAEALSCGTPVVAFRRGGIPELLAHAAGRLLDPVAAPVDAAPEMTLPALDAAVAAVAEVRRLDRVSVRDHAVRHLGLTAMLTGYERCYAGALDRWPQG